MSDTPRITVCPPGEAFGARDLQRWAQRRTAGRASVPLTRPEYQRIKQIERDAERVLGIRSGRETYESYLERIADSILRSARARR